MGTVLVISGSGSWFPERKAQAQNKIKDWARIYTHEQVLFLVREELRTTRSPGKKAGYQEWLEAHKEESL